MLNIPSTVVDSNYRYRMPRMQLKIESQGNGIKTNIVNLQDVAKHLRTDESYILKFFGFERASQTIEKSSENKSSKKQGKTNTSYIIQGSFTEEQLLKTLDKFIQKYILCPKCKLPELNMYIKSEKIHGKCDSCPFNGQLDNKHKITSTIVKNPPVPKPQVIKSTKMVEKEEKKEQKTEEKPASNPLPETKQQQKKQQKQQVEPASRLFSSQNLEFGSEQLVKLIEYTRKYIEARKGIDFDIASAEAVDNLKPLALKKTLFAYVIFNSLFTINIAKQVQENAAMYKKLMLRLVGSNQTSNQIETLLNLQYLFLEVNKEKDFSKYISTILDKLHEVELISKQLILKWSKNEIKDIEKYFLYNEARNEKFLAMAADFVDYLQNESDQQTEEK